MNSASTGVPIRIALESTARAFKLAPALSILLDVPIVVDNTEEPALLVTLPAHWEPLLPVLFALKGKEVKR